MQAQVRRPRKSVKFEKSELTQFKKWVADQPTKYDAALTIGISRQALDMILLRGSSKEAIITKIKTLITA